jgi:hypothetical protein
VQHGPRQVPTPASDIGDRGKAAEVVGRQERGDIRRSPRRHRLSEDPRAYARRILATADDAERQSARTT